MKSASRFAVLGALLALALIPLAISLRGQSRWSKSGESAISSLGARESLHELKRIKAELDPSSTQGRRIARQLERVRRKAAQTTATAQNPGAFLQALAEIKTSIDGRTYPPNYKVVERERAMKRRKGAQAQLPWVERGPGNVSGRARAILVDPDDPAHETWLVATVGGGIWKTTDGGTSWQDKTPDLTTLSTTCMAWCASDPDVIYAGTGMGYGRIVDLEGSGVWKSIDRGESWNQLASTANGELLDAVNRIVVDPTNPDVVVLCSNDQFSHLGPNGGTRISGIFKSIDGGASWRQVYDPDLSLGTGTDNRIQQIIANPLNFGTLYATVNEVGVIKSVDAGESWFVSAGNFALPSDVGNPTGNGYGLAGISVRTEIAMAPSDTSRLYAAVERPRGVGDLYVSADAGASWQLLGDTTGDPNWFNAFGVSGTQGYTAGWFDNTIAVHPFDADVVFVGGVNLYRVDVNLASSTRSTQPIGWWIPNAQGIPVVHADHHWLEMVPIDQQSQSFWVLDANDGGLGVSRNRGVSWSQITGMGTTQFYGAAKKPGADVYIGGMQDNGTWHSGLDPDRLSSWSFDIGGDGFEVAWSQADGNLVLGGSQFGNYSRSTDGGNTWTGIPDAQAGNAPFISKIASSNLDPYLVYTVGDAGVKRSDDFGASWTSGPIFGSWLGYRPFANVEISVADPQVVWISSRLTIDPPSGQRGGIHVSDDGGFGFQAVHGSLPPGMTESSGIGTHSRDGQTAYLLFSAPSSPKVLRTTDLGASWEDISGFTPPTKDGGDGPGGGSSSTAKYEISANGFPDVAVFSLLVMPYDPDILWAGTEIGLFVSGDGGSSWEYADSGLPAVAIFQLAIFEDQVVAATQGRGIWSVRLDELAEVVPPAVILAPRLLSVAQLPAGNVGIDIDLRSPYDSTIVTVNNVAFHRFEANASPLQQLLEYPVSNAGTVTASVTAYRAGRVYRTPPKTAFGFPVAVVDDYESGFDSAGDGADFLGTGFSVRGWTGFQGQALHSAHSYPTNANPTFMLRVPVRVRDRQAHLRYSDVALIEVGSDPHYTDPQFWDYVIVEGTVDGAHWLPLIDGYDSRAHPLWLGQYETGLDGSGGSNAPGDESLYVDHTIDLLETFAPGDVIFIRFRLFSDAAATAWGWAIDDLSIQATPLSTADREGGEVPGSDLPRVTRLAQNHPNPFNPSTVIEYELAQGGGVELVVYDAAGRRVRGLVHERDQIPGRYTVRWDGLDDGGRAVASGVYHYRLRADGRQFSRKLTLVR